MKRRLAKFRSILLGLTLLLVLFAQQAGSTRAEAVVDHVVTNDSVTGLTVDSPCANDGAGEAIMFDGHMHSVAHFTGTADGFINAIYNDFQQWQGVGLTTGDHYVGRTNTHSVTIMERETDVISLRGSITVIETGSEHSRLEFGFSMFLHIVGDEVVVDRVDFVSECQ